MNLKSEILWLILLIPKFSGNAIWKVKFKSDIKSGFRNKICQVSHQVCNYEINSESPFFEKIN